MDSVATSAGTASAGTREGYEGAVLVDTDKVRAHVDEVVRSTVEETLNAMLDAEADRVAGAGKYERSPERMDTRAGSYQRKLQTKAGEVTLKVPRPAVPQGRVPEVVAMLKAIHAQEDRASAEQKAALVVEKLKGMRLAKAAGIVREGVSETLSYMAFPASTGGASRPTTRWSGSIAKCGDARAWSAPSPTGRAP